MRGAALAASVAMVVCGLRCGRDRQLRAVSRLRKFTQNVLPASPLWLVLGTVNTVVQVPENDVPCTITEVLAALKEQNIEARHERRDWGDWIVLRGSGTVISIESMRGLTSSATIEHAEDEADGLALRLQCAFHRLGWEGIDEDGSYALG